jgi:chromosome segregation ATPase
MKMSISGKVKIALAEIEALQKTLGAVDQDGAELDGVRGALDTRRAELAEVEARIVRASEQFAKDDVAHSAWRQAAAVEQTKGNAKVDQLQAKLRELEASVAEAEARHENILAGIAALHARLKVA